MPLVSGSIRSISPPTSFALYSSNVCQPGLASAQEPPQLALLNEIVPDAPPPQAVSDAVTATMAMVSTRVFRMTIASIDPGSGVAPVAPCRYPNVHKLYTGKTRHSRPRLWWPGPSGGAGPG